jgi:uncharacterized damage-inducible protein DinB
MMKRIQILKKEMEQEAQTTRKFLSLVPKEKFDWQPHPKSMTLMRLATHIAELPGWVPMILNTKELDFATGAYQPKEVADNKELMDFFEEKLIEGQKALSGEKEDDLELPWTLRNGEEVYETSLKSEFIRTTFSQIVHHRAQLGVYLRLLDIPIPGSYGPSADDQSF